ncbi:la-related protein 6-like [Lytechinus variegatus]|uniref:la-related protein 6-like n=1 Tax=Lytechinus variegatus TaxID=7654 RepID=UPI001BB2A4ED|nr:la-related protein 6-like [Lytechinus variegatus]
MSQVELIEKMENGTPGHTNPAGGTIQSHVLKSDECSRSVAGHNPNGSDRANLPPTIPPPPVVHISRPSEADGSGLEESGDDSSDHADGRSSDERDERVQHADGIDGAKSDPGDDDQNEESSPVKDWKPPDADLVQKIVEQVEFYFSDANIVKDTFLLKHLRRNKQGFVSIKLIASFKKVRGLSKDWKSVRYSLQQSEKLIVNNEGTKVKRKAPLPEYDETTNSRTVVAVNLPMENPSVEKISHLFQPCGEISLIRIIRPGNPIPQDVRKQVESHTAYSQKKACALVEFEKTESAHKAAKIMSDEDNWRTGLHVSLLINRPKQKEKKERKSHKESLSPQTQPADDAASVDGDGDAKKKKRRRKKKRNSNRLDELSCDGSGVTGTPSSSDVDNPSEHKNASKPIPIQQQRSPNHLSPATTPKSSPCPSPHGSPRSQRKHGKSPLAASGVRNSPKGSPRCSPEMSRKNYDRRGSGGGDHSDSSNSSPWVRRRMLLSSQDKSPLAAGSSPCGSPMLGRRQMADAAGIIRSPHGPGGVSAFYGGKGRGKPLNEP